MIFTLFFLSFSHPWRLTLSKRNPVKNKEAKAGVIEIVSHRHWSVLMENDDYHSTHFPITLHHFSLFHQNHFVGNEHYSIQQIIILYATKYLSPPFDDGENAISYSNHISRRKKYGKEWRNVFYPRPGIFFSSLSFLSLFLSCQSFLYTVLSEGFQRDSFPLFKKLQDSLHFTFALPSSFLS